MANLNNRHYDLHSQGMPLFNGMKNSTSALGHALEVTEVNLNLTITRHDEAQDNHGRLLQAVTQHALVAARNNVVISDNNLVTTGRAVDAARLSQDNQRVRTVAMHEVNTVYVVQYTGENIGQIRRYAKIRVTSTSTVQF